MNKYIVVIEASKPPQLFLGDDFAGGKIVELKTEDSPNLVSVTWIMKRFNLSRANVLEKLKGHNKGSDGKHLYDPKIAEIILSKQKIKPGPKRIN